MTLPVASNTTCDIYRTGHAPPSAPDVAGVAGCLKPDYRMGSQNSEGLAYRIWTHVLLVDTSVDIRDGYTTASTGPSNTLNQDTLYIPDKNGVKYFVVFVEQVRGAGACKRVFLGRAAVTWPPEANSL
jgi:hypothetical protein